MPQHNNMKVTEQMIAKELRLPGKVYHLFTSVGPTIKMRGIKITKRYLKNPLDPNQIIAEQQYLKRKDGSYLRLLIHKPKSNERKVPGVLWLHGGGYAIGMPEMIYLSMARLIKDECVIVAPDYLLSTEQPYPAALRDSYQALLWMKKHASELGIDDEQLFVGGESAGGGLTAALCLYARDKGTVNIAYQMPIYPMLDDRMMSESMKDNDAPVWDEEQNKTAWKLYLKDCSPDKTPKYAAPAREDNYIKLPPAVTFVGSLDPFRDETIEYADKLKNAGIPVQLQVFDGCFHAFDMMVPWSPQAKQAREFFLDNFHHACKVYRAAQNPVEKND